MCEVHDAQVFPTIFEESTSINQINISLIPYNFILTLWIISLDSESNTCSMNNIAKFKSKVVQESPQLYYQIKLSKR